jgi:hypothetical protein
LDANGEALFYTGAGVAYKLTVKDASAALIWTEDNIIFGGGSGSSVVGSSSEWVAVSGTPTFIDATHFAYVGDQTATFTVGRRLKPTVTAGTAYGTVAAVSFSAGNTTVTTLNDSTALDSGLSSVQVGLLDPAHMSMPNYSTAIRKNWLTNGAMMIAQRANLGTPVTLAAAAGYTPCDRWQGKTGAGGNATFTQIGTVNLLNGFPFAMRVQRVAANAAVTPIQLAQSLETVDSVALNGQTMLLSFWALIGSNYSAAGNLLNVQVIGGTGVDQNVLAGYTGAVVQVNANVNIGPGTWNKFQLPLFGMQSAGAQEFGVVFTYTPTGVAGINDTFSITGVQLETAPLPGNVAASDFDHQPFPIMLERCQRYFQKTFPYGTTPANNAGPGGAAMSLAKRAAAVADGLVYECVVPMRGTPTVASFNPSAANAQARDATGAVDCSAIAFANASFNGVAVTFTANAATAINNLFEVHLTLDAEL